MPEYYTEDNRGRKLLDEWNLTPTAQDSRLINHPLHSAHRYEAILATLDPELMRPRARRAAGLFQVDGYELDPLEQTVANGRHLIDYHAGIAVEAIRVAIDGER